MIQRAVAASSSGTVPPLQQKPKRPRYCFRGMARLVDHNGISVATFTAYDKSPLVGKRVFDECELASRIDSAYHHPLTAQPAELVFFPECPCECTGDISVM